MRFLVVLSLVVAGYSQQAYAHLYITMSHNTTTNVGAAYAHYYQSRLTVVD